jgi:uncharacterized membrane protein YoaK (UPF0700 family)
VTRYWSDEEHRKQAMTFEEIVDQAIAMLQRRRRVTYQALKFQFHLDDEQLEALKEALIEAEQLAVDEAEKVLVWTPRAPAPPTAVTSITLRNGLVLLLACVAGGVDAVSYMSLGHVFTANMTGNTVLLGLAFGQAESRAVVRSSLALIGFLAGAFLGAWGGSRGRHSGIWPPDVTITLVVEEILLIAMAVVWHLASDLDSNQATRAILILLSALAMGIQSAVGRQLNISGIATTYITGTLTSLMARLIGGMRGTLASGAGPHQSGLTAGAAHEAPKVGLLAATWVIYIGGAAAAATMIAFLEPLLALALPIALLTVVILTAVSYFRR